jgi:hypothetical protein
MTSNSDELAKALRENLKLRRELATEVAEAKGDRLASLRLCLARIFGAFRYTLFGRIKPASVSAAIGELEPARKPMALKAGGKQPHQLPQPSRQTNPGECRQRALECVRLSQTTNDPEARKTWSDLAKTWLTFAADIEANACLLDEWGRPKPRGRLASLPIATGGKAEG